MSYLQSYLDHVSLRPPDPILVVIFSGWFNNSPNMFRTLFLKFLILSLINFNHLSFSKKVKVFFCSKIKYQWDCKYHQALFWSTFESVSLPVTITTGFAQCYLITLHQCSSSLLWYWIDFIFRFCNLFQERPSQYCLQTMMIGMKFENSVRKQENIVWILFQREWYKLK